MTASTTHQATYSHIIDQWRMPKIVRRWTNNNVQANHTPNDKTWQWSDDWGKRSNFFNKENPIDRWITLYHAVNTKRKRVLKRRRIDHHAPGATPLTPDLIVVWISIHKQSPITKEIINEETFLTPKPYATRGREEHARTAIITNQCDPTVKISGACRV